MSGLPPSDIGTKLGTTSSHEGLVNVVVVATK